MKKIIAIINLIAALIWIGGTIWRRFGEIPEWAEVLTGVGIIVWCIISIYNCICKIIVFRRNKTHE